MSLAKEAIREFVRSKLSKKKNHTTVDDKSNIIEAGIIDSLGIMQLVEFIENKFSLKVKDEDIIPDNFESIETISSFIDRSL